MFFEFGIKDFIDILLVAFLLYYTYKLMKASGSINVFTGILVFILIWLVVSQVLEMKLLGSIFDKLVSVGVLALIVLFQDEIRRFLLTLGSHQHASALVRFLTGNKKEKLQHDDIMPIVMACINYPTTVGAMTLYNVTKDPDYLEKAKSVYAWSRDVFFDKEKGRIADNMHYHFQRQNGMDIDWTTQLYNQATFIGSAVMLYKATGEKAYLDDAVLAADYVRNEMCDADGLLPFKNGVEQGIYAAIFAQYIIRLIEDGNQLQYMDWLRHNIDVAWNNRDVNRNVTFKDAAKPCPTGVMESYDASGCPALMQVISPFK